MPEWHCRRCLDDAGGQRRAGSLAEPHAERRSGSLPILSSTARCAVFAETWPTRQWSSAVGLAACRTAAADGRDETVYDHGNFLDARGQNGAGHGGDLAAAEPAQDLQRIVEMIADAARPPPLPRRASGPAPSPVDAGARPTQSSAAAAIKGMEDRRRHGGVADAHFADAQKIDAAGTASMP